MDIKINKNGTSASIITTIEWQDYPLVFLDGKLNIISLSKEIENSDLKIIVKEHDNYDKSLGHEITIDLLSKRNIPIFNIIDGKLFINYKYHNFVIGDGKSTNLYFKDFTEYDRLKIENLVNGCELNDNYTKIELLDLF